MSSKYLAHTVKTYLISSSVQDVTTRECSELVHVDPVTVTEYLDTVKVDYKGKCGQRVLKQQQQVSLSIYSMCMKQC